MIRKKVLAASLCLIAALAVGCTSDNGKQAETQKKIEIHVIYPTSRAMGDKHISEFEEWFTTTFPDAELDMISAPITTVSDTVKSEFKNGNSPDVFVTTEYDTFVHDGYFADITGLPALTKFRKSSVRSLENDGRVYALPIGGGNLIALHYNKTLFDEYGLEYPKSTENLYDVVLRVNKVIEENNLEKRAVGASLLYPSQASAVMNGALAEITQTSEYLEWITDYGEEDFSFKDEQFQNYLKKMDFMINKQKDAGGNAIPTAGKLFGRDDYFSTQSSSITSFLKGSSFMYIGDVNRTYATYGTEGTYDKSDMAVMGIPVGIQGVDYISYMDELYMGISSEYPNYSSRKQEIISELLEHFTDADSNIKNIFTFTGDYCSVYLEGLSVQRNEDPYFEEINNSLDQNFVAQEVNNTPFSNVFGKVILAWKLGNLGKIVENSNPDIEKITEILETYYTTGVSMFAKSEEPIGTSKYFMEYQSNIVRSQETAIGNQVADMARNYMKTDFALINAGGIRASVPQGDISVQTLNSMLPYVNYLVKINVSGATLKKAIANAYNVGPIYKSGQFGEISGLKVKLETNRAGYSKFEAALSEWEKTHPDAGEIKKNAAIKDIVDTLCSKDPDMLNLDVVSVTDLEGDPIEDDKIYTLATLDYLLKGGDDYTMLGVLNGDADADTSIEIYDKVGNLISGTKEQKLEIIEKGCESLAESFVSWVKAGNELQSQIDGRIEIENFIYVE